MACRLVFGIFAALADFERELIPVRRHRSSNQARADPRRALVRRPIAALALALAELIPMPPAHPPLGAVVPVDTLDDAAELIILEWNQQMAVEHGRVMLDLDVGDIWRPAEPHQVLEHPAVPPRPRTRLPLARPAPPRRHHRTQFGQAERIAGLNLLAAIIIYWNTQKLSEAVFARQKADLETPAEFLTHVSPLGWEHINLTGEYRWPGAGRAGPRPT